ncbi:uncharacterized protein GLRG_09027 [Colletotrichum graminicola M1.001]|uniref:BTB domain-containing protein n=1 Tax=Colletotrichum graminicola (strain M1.001 / M2 / FGSC 10212) TaxID=645133 RepID=E3QSP5_COLGM|nr:uncharacterized protein GLRG_09027 [Colletotrichum graminicola M1.001]EFQ33883.1 hypothetical protein GLRG_09027 [Colletotrichum graminicola M1.001]
MDESDVLSLWETKKGADILLTMGTNKWQLHEHIIRGKSGLIDHILDLTIVQNDIRKIALKEHAFTASALEVALKYIYVGDGVFDRKTEVIELLAIYDVSVTLAVSSLQQLIAPRIGNLLRDILTSRIDLIEDFIIATDVIVSEEADTWAIMRQELQNAISPHIGMLFSQQEFTSLVRTNQTFCFETLSTAIARMDVLEKGAGDSNDPSNLRDDGDAGQSKSSPTAVSCNATQTDIQASSGALKPFQEGANVPSTGDSMSDSDKSIHWESCSEGATTSVSRTQKLRASGLSTPVTPQAGTSTPSRISGRTIEQRPVASRVVERIRNPFALKRSSISQKKEPAAPNLERTSHTYAFSGSSVPRDFQFFGATQTEQTTFTSTGTNPRYTQNNATPQCYSLNKQTRGSSSRESGVKKASQLDHVTAHEVKKGRLVVEPHNGQLSASDRVLLDGPRIECNPS